jgi:hypothetical protein
MHEPDALIHQRRHPGERRDPSPMCSTTFHARQKRDEVSRGFAALPRERQGSTKGVWVLAGAAAACARMTVKFNAY